MWAKTQLALGKEDVGKGKQRLIRDEKEDCLAKGKNCKERTGKSTGTATGLVTIPLLAAAG